MQLVMDLKDLDRERIAVAGGKAASLGELSRIDGVRVPDGCCVTTDAFATAMAEVPGLGALLDRLSRLGPDDRAPIAALSADVRAAIEKTPVPAEVAAQIAAAVARLGADDAYAVRSSATAEDLPTASFAGQHDSYLDVAGTAAIVEHVRRCWASLFTERAVTYRLRNGFERHEVRMAVVVQRLVRADAAGVLFTADPVTSNRKVAAVEAVRGLGESLVAGHVTPDVYTVRDGALLTRRIEHERPVLTEAQVVRLVDLGRAIEAHFGAPQDIEWCLAGDDVAVVQSRPITTLFPVPAEDDGELHVYVSVGHQQMMTEAMRPLGLSVWARTTPRRMSIAGGRLFVDVTSALASPASRPGVLALGRSDPLIGDALRTLVDREVVRPLPAPEPARRPLGEGAAELPTDTPLVAELVERAEAAVEASRRAIASKSGTALLDFVLADFEDLRRVLFDPRSMDVIMAGFQAAEWLNERLEAWLGEKNAADVLTRSVPGNVTSEMGLALLDVADAIRPHPEVVAFLQRVERDGFEDERLLDHLGTPAGGAEARAALQAYLDRYGMRCVGEIDITRPRWSERPTALVPALLGNVRNFEPGEAERRFERGRREALAKRDEVLARLRALPDDGASKAEETERMIDRVRAFAGYREHPKYAMVSRYFVYRQALMSEAERLARDGVLRERDDVFWFSLEELREIVRTRDADHELLDERKRAFASYEALTPPRVFTSDGEVVTGAYRRGDLPDGALAGLPVSAGTVEGRARVVRDIAQADLEPGDILVTAYTDPSWTPVFVSIAGLVTEVGGLMTHGAVIAREYGLPAVVGVEEATRLIPDGSRIRVHGTDGYVELVR
ncbi:MAG TPA: rifamycin-inactivating phosphotransferase [Solirubrobacteraceae bacterium]|jgi:pyruvate,water dikinase